MVSCRSAAGCAAGRGGRADVGELLWSCCFISGDGVLEVGLVEEDARAVEEEPGDGDADEDGDVDGLAEAGAGALVVDGVEQVDELVLLEFAVAAGADTDGLCGAASRLVAAVWSARRIGRQLKEGHGGSEDRTQAGGRRPPEECVVRMH